MSYILYMYFDGEIDAWYNGRSFTDNSFFSFYYITVQITLLGSTQKDIQAGTLKWQLYETEVKSFMDSGDSPYFVCDHKGCNPSKGVALKYKNGTSGAFTLSTILALPEKANKGANDFKLVVWGEDQDHSPYDFSASIGFSYGNGP